MNILTRVWRWLLNAVPSDEQLDAQDTPQLREFYNRIEENWVIARRQLAEVHDRNHTTSPIRRRAS